MFPKNELDGEETPPPMKEKGLFPLQIKRGEGQKSIHAICSKKKHKHPRGKMDLPLHPLLHQAKGGLRRSSRRRGRKGAVLSFVDLQNEKKNPNRTSHWKGKIRAETYEQGVQRHGIA